MFWSLSIYRLIRPKERYIRVQIRILHETEKALLIHNGMKIWIPKSQLSLVTSLATSGWVSLYQSAISPNTSCRQTVDFALEL